MTGMNLALSRPNSYHGDIFPVWLLAWAVCGHLLSVGSKGTTYPPTIGTCPHQEQGEISPRQRSQWREKSVWGRGNGGDRQAG